MWGHRPVGEPDPTAVGVQKPPLTGSGRESGRASFRLPRAPGHVGSAGPGVPLGFFRCSHRASSLQAPGPGQAARPCPSPLGKVAKRHSLLLSHFPALEAPTLIPSVSRSDAASPREGTRSPVAELGHVTGSFGRGGRHGQTFTQTRPVRSGLARQALGQTLAHGRRGRAGRTLSPGVWRPAPSLPLCSKPPWREGPVWAPLPVPWALRWRAGLPPARSPAAIAFGTRHLTFLQMTGPRGPPGGQGLVGWGGGWASRLLPVTEAPRPGERPDGGGRRDGGAPSASARPGFTHVLTALPCRFLFA